MENQLERKEGAEDREGNVKVSNGWNHFYLKYTKKIQYITNSIMIHSQYNTQAITL